jgi:uncharacterized protein (TIGR03435 family)
MMLAVSNSLAGWIVVKVTIAAALGLLATWLARGNRAAVRHALLAATFGVMILVPAATLLMPPLHVGLPVTVERPAALLPFGLVSDSQSSGRTVGAGTRTASAAPQASKLTLSNVLVVTWGAGAALFLLPVVAGLWQIRRLRRSGLPWRRGQLLAEALAIEIGVDRRIEVLLQETLPGPMTCGVVRPAIILPQDAESWSADDLKRAIIHELEHVRRGDSVSRGLARAVCAVYWFHPLIWIVWRKLVLEAERSCDDAVLRCSEGTAYADQLVGLAKRLLATQRWPVLAMANRADLATRVGAVLDSRQRRGRAGIFPVALVCGAAAALVITISPLTLVGAPQAVAPLQTAAGEKAVFEVASVKPAIPLGPLGMRSDQKGGPGTSDPGLFTCRNCSLYWVLADAYPIHGYDFSGPDWLQSERFDFSAKIPAGATREEFQRMLQNLMAERFLLKVHREIRPMQVYELTVTKGGPKFKQSTPKEPAGDDSAPGPLKRDADGFPILTRGMNMAIIPGHARMQSENQSMAWFAERLSQQLQVPVKDATGLTGGYDFTVSWSWEENTPGAQAAAQADLVSAVQSQLGLKLEQNKGQWEVLVVEHIAKTPTEN